MKKFRQLSSNLFAKIMLILIAVSFIVVGGISSTRSIKKSIASVDGNEISASDIESKYRIKINQLGLSKNPSNTLKIFRIVEQILEQQINLKSKTVHNSELGLSVSDDFVAEKLKNIKVFQTLNKFDENKFKRILAFNNISVDDFLNDYKNELINNKYDNSLKSFVFTPKHIIKTLARYNSQTRDIIKAQLMYKDVRIKNPSNKKLQDYYNTNKFKFEIGEKRDISVLNISTDSIVKKISDKQAKKTYNNNKEQFSTPEKRSFYSISATQQQLSKLKQEFIKTKDIKKAIKAVLNEDPNKLLTKLASVKDIDNKTKNIIFKINKNKLSNPTNLGFGKVVFFVTDIQAGSTKTFNEVKDKIKSQLAQERMLDIATEVEDLISEGLEINQISRKIGFEIIKINKMPIEGIKSKSFTQNTTFRQTVFKKEANELTDLIEMNDNDFAIAVVNKIYKKNIPSFNKIKNIVKNKYIKEQKIITAKNKLKELITLSSFKEFNKKSKENGFKTNNINKLSLEKSISNPINIIAFQGNQNTVKTKSDDKGVYAIYIRKINVPKQAKQNLLKKVKNDVINIMDDNLLNSISSYIKENQDIEKDSDLIEAIYERN